MSLKSISSALVAIHAGLSSAQTVWPSVSYVTENFTSPQLKVTKSGTTAPGYLFYDPAGSGTSSQAPLITTDDGELIWHGPSSNSSSPNSYWNFKTASLNGSSVLSYWYGYSLATFGHGFGGITILNSSYDAITTICVDNSILQINPGINVTLDCFHDQHESYITDYGTIIASAYNTTQADLTSVGGPADGWIFDGIFHEIDIATQEVLFTWRSTDHLDEIPFSASQELPVTGRSEASPWDYFHINSIQPLADGYLVNSRHCFETYKISKNGSIEWIISGIDGGDFTFDDPIYFSWQHFPRVVNSTATTLTIDYFNNDNAGGTFNGTNSTTGFELLVNLDTKHITRTKLFTNPAQPLFADSQGSTQLIDGEDGHYLMGYGQLPVIREYDSSGAQIYQAEFGPIYPTGGNAVSSYRAYKYVWDATPSFAPKLNAQTVNGSITYYVSWNGATNVDSWVISAGNSTGKLTSAFTIQSVGFETNFKFSGPFKYLSAQAVIGNQTSASSNVVAAGVDSATSGGTSSVLIAPGSGGVKTSGTSGPLSTTSRSTSTPSVTTTALVSQLPDGQVQATSASAKPSTSVTPYAGNAAVVNQEAGLGVVGALIVAVGALLV